MADVFSLSIPERINLMSILPAEGNFVTLRILRDLKRELSFSEAEIVEFEISVDGDKGSFNPLKAKNKVVPIGPQASKIIVEQLQKLAADENAKVNMGYLELYERFVGETEIHAIP